MSQTSLRMNKIWLYLWITFSFPKLEYTSKKLLKKDDNALADNLFTTSCPSTSFAYKD